VTDATIQVDVRGNTTPIEGSLTRTRRLAVAFDAEMQKSLSGIHESLNKLTTSNDRLAASLLKTNAAKRQAAQSTQSLERSLKMAERAGMQMGTTLSRHLIGIATAFAGIRQVTGQIEEVASIGRLSQQSGIAVQQLSALKFAAEEVGIPFNQLENTIRSFAQRMAEGLVEPSSRVSLALRELGVSVRDSDGNLRNFAQVLPDIANAFAAAQDSVSKTQIAIALFGEETGTRLIPLLNRGAAGLEELMRKAKELGVVFDQDAVRRAQQLRVTSVQLQSAINALTNEIIRFAAPAITAAAKTLTDLLRAATDASRGTGAVTGSVAELSAELERLNSQRQRIERNKWLPGASQMLDDISNRAARVQEQMNKLIGLRGTINPFEEDAAREKQRLADLAALEAAARDARLRAQADLDTYLSTVSGGGTFMESLNFAWTNHADIVAMANEKIIAAHERRVEAEIRMGQVERQLNIQREQAAITVARTLASTITSLFPKQKGAAIASAVINTGVAVTEAMKLPFPLNWAQAALVAASGAAQIASIRSASLSGGSTASVGGSAGVPGTIGSGPELGETEPRITRSIHISMDKGALWSSEQIQELIENINGEVKNGSTLISTSVR
jgi:hypothetical protein